MPLIIPSAPALLVKSTRILVIIRKTLGITFYLYYSSEKQEKMHNSARVLRPGQLLGDVAAASSSL